MAYIDSRAKVFGHLGRLGRWQDGEKPAPVTIEWDLSNRCVLGCQDCHFAHTHTRGPWASRDRALPTDYDSGGDLADLAVVQKGLSQMAEAGVKGVVWSGGGEPTTHPELEQAVAHAAKVGMAQGMYTLGGLLTLRLADTLANHLEWAVVSLDACDEESYAREKGVTGHRFGKALRGIEMLASHKRATVGVSFLLHGENWHRHVEMLALARSLGATYATFRPAIRTSPADPAVCSDDRGWITEAVAQMRRFAEEPDVEIDLQRFEAYRDWAGRSYKTCYGIRVNAVLTPDGRVWLCPQRRGVPGSCIGDLRRESFAEIWARHPGQWVDFSGCRVMCRLHLMNETLSTVFEQRQHEAFL